MIELKGLNEELIKVLEYMFKEARIPKSVYDNSHYNAIATSDYCKYRYEIDTKSYEEFDYII